ncbi:MAG: type III pantothenate kinase [Pseudoflavonifractor sp.]
MILAIDVGNTNMVFGIFDGDALVGNFRLMTDINRTSDEIGLLACAYFQRFGLDTARVEDVIIASVVPPVMYTLTNAVTKYFGRAPLIVDEDVDPGLPYCVSGNERLGPDRAIACVAALEKYGGPIIVLDFGTATTLDAVSREGVYQGGCITAGVRISTEALFQKTARLPNVELAMPERVLGYTAVSQIQAGAVMSYIGAMEYLICHAKEELGGGEIKVIATGGLARMVAENTKLIDTVDSGLVLEGLYLLYRRTRA